MSPRNVPDHDVDDDAVAVVELAQQHRLREREPEPVDAEQRAGDRDRGAGRAGPASATARNSTGTGRERDLEHLPLAAEVAPAMHMPASARKPTSGTGFQRSSMRYSSAMRRAAEHRHRDRPRETADVDEHDRDHERRYRDEHPAQQIRSRAPARRGPGLWHQVRPFIGGIGRYRSTRHQRPPKRRLRAAYSSRLSANASRVKSGHSSSRNTNSE